MLAPAIPLPNHATDCPVLSLTAPTDRPSSVVPSSVRLAALATSQSYTLVTGGAGYIGAHAVLALTSRGRNVVVLDDLSTGNAQVVPSGVPLVVGAAGDRHLVESILTEYRVSAVLHFAGRIVVPESVRLDRKSVV